MHLLYTLKPRQPVLDLFFVYTFDQNLATKKG